MSKIPVYQVSVPEYRFKKFSSRSKKKEYAEVPWFGIQIPKIYIEKRPDFSRVGTKIDKCLKNHFLGKKIAIRVISSQDHPGKSVDQLIKIIKKLGHDRYDPKRKGDRYDNIENKHIDFFALDFKVKANREYFKDFIEPFYYWLIANKKPPLRVDIATIYDFSKLKVVKHQYAGREGEVKEDGFIFRHPHKKPEAILGIIKIL